MNTASWHTLLPYLLSATITLGISIYTFRRRNVPGAQAFSCLALFEFIWITGYIFQLYAPTLPGKLFWNNVQFLGAVASPVAYLWFAGAFSGRLSQGSKILQRGVNLIGFGMLCFIWSDGWHHLFRTNPHILPGAPFDSLVFVDGPAFHLYPYFGYPLLIAGTYFLVRNFFDAPRIYRVQIATVLAGILIPWITTVVTWLRWVPINLHDVTPISFGISNLIAGWALLKHRLFDLVPIAYSLLVKQMEDGLVVLDESQRILDLNPAALRILNLSERPVIGTDLIEIQPIFRTCIAHKNQNTLQTDLILPVNGTERNFDIRVTPIIIDRPGSMKGSLVILRDINDRKDAEKKLQHMAVTDPLTRVYNRRHFFDLADEEVSQAFRSKQPTAILLIDIDHFKQVNDTYGHTTGDEVLVGTVSLCQRELGPSDILARYGGDEFIVLLCKQDTQMAMQVGERLREQVEKQEFVSGSEKIPITISAGVSSMRGNKAISTDELIKQADLALYEAKNKGRNQVKCFHPTGEENL